MTQASRPAATSAHGIYGRDAEFVRILEFLDAIPQGPRALLIEGEPGVGKTTIWSWAVERAAELPYAVLTCRPVEAEAKWSYAAVTDLLAPVGADVYCELPPLQRRAIEGALLREAAEGETVDPRAVGAAVLAVLRTQAGSRPTIVAVDDAQWLDGASARVLQFAIRRLRSEQLGVLITQRTREDGGVALGLDRTLLGDAFSRMPLGPLTLGALHHVVRARLGTELSRAVLVQLHATSGGNPFYALEIGRELRARGLENQPGALIVPPSLRELVKGRLERLPRRTQDVLLIVAAVSQPTLALVAAAAERPDLLEDDIDRAAQAGVIEIQADRIRFAHPLLATVHYAAASAVQRRALHQRLAGVITDIEERARHLALATTGPDRAVAEALDGAAARARVRGAPEAAAAFLEDARRLTPVELVGDLWRRTTEGAMCHYLAGDTARARQLWEDVEASAPAGPARASALWHLAEFRSSTLQLKQQIEVADRALREAGDDLALKSAVHHTLALTLAWGNEVLKAEPHAHAALELALADGDPTVVALARTASAWVGFLAGRGISSELLDRTLTLEKATRHLPLENSPRSTLAAMRGQVGEEVDAAREAFLESRRHAQESGMDVSLPLLLFYMSDLECRTGNWDLAAQYARESMEITARTGQVFRAPLGLLAMALIDARRGRLASARVAAEEALATTRKVGPRFVEAKIMAALGFIELSADDPEAAHRWLETVVELEGSGGYGEPTSFRAAPDDIEALIALGDLERAGTLVHRLEAAGRRLDRVWALATGARSRGLLAAARGDLDASRQALAQALAEHRRLVEPFERARTLLALGSVQRRCREKRTARDSLQQAATIFRSLGAAGWAARTEAELKRLGARAAAPDALTPTEERVARLVAAGRTNREIAGALFVSVKAVEANLTHIYAKLGVRSRTELALRVGSAQT